MGDFNVSSDEEEDMFEFATRKLIALYDYSYKDDFGQMVHMKEGEEYHLLQKSGDWWEVIRHSAESDDSSFYVPANYVKFLDDNTESASTNTTHDSDVIHTTGSEKGRLGHDTVQENLHSSQDGVNNVVHTKTKHKTDEKMDIYANTSSFMTNNNNVGISSDRDISTRPGVYRQSLTDEGDYMNLHDFQQRAGLPSQSKPPPSDNADSNIYANLQELNIQAQPTNTSPPISPEEPPIPDEKNCPYVRTLLNVWDQYCDPMTKRNFYIHQETKEKTWKPPRYPHKKKANLNKKVDIPVSTPVIPDVRIDRASIVAPDGWTSTSDPEGKTVFTNLRTQEKWGTHTDENGKPYFYNVDTGETAWKLPEVLTMPNGDPAADFRSNLPRSRSPPGTSPQVPRSVKTQSMFLESQLSFGSFPGQTGPIMSKSFTLPAAQSQQGPEGDFSVPKSQTLPYNLQGISSVSPETDKRPVHPGTSNQGAEKICGVLKKRMILESGKSVKKSLSTSFVKLLGTNLVFYKNRQAAQQGSRHGKPEFMEPLQGAHVDKHQTNKKQFNNTLVLTTCNKNQYQLQLEDEIDMQKWLSVLQLTIQELGPCAVDPQLLASATGGLGPPDSLKKSGSFKRRKVSEVDQDDEKKSFKTIFERWMRDPQRPTKKQLEDKGIIEYNVFGGHLKQVCEKDKSKVPKFVQRCVAAIEKRGLEQDGLYRISGNMAQITKLRSMLNMDKFDYDLDNPELWDIHVLAGGLKLFFRELKEPLFTHAQFDKFIIAISQKKRSDKLKHIKDQVTALPKCNYETLKFLGAHLLRVADKQSVNKMSIANLAIVFGPTLLWKEMDAHFMAHMVMQGQIVEFVLLEYKNIFK